MRITMRWVSHVEVSAEIDVDLATLAQWAVDELAVRRLAGMTLGRPTSADLVDSMRTNPHLRNRICQQYAIANGLTQNAPSARRDEPPSSELTEWQ